MIPEFLGWKQIYDLGSQSHFWEITETVDLFAFYFKAITCQLREAMTLKRLKEIYAKTARWMKQQQQSVTWFEIKIFYIKIDTCGCDSAPGFLTVHYAPRSRSTDLEINGKIIRPSASAFVTLRRNGIDENGSVATYVSTDMIRTNGKVCFDVCVRDEILICGTLERKVSVKDYDASQICQQTWTVECSCALDYPSKWSLAEANFDKFPSLELYVAGRVGSLPMVLTHTEQLIPRKKRVRHGVTLDVIPEGNDYENSLFNSADHNRLENKVQYEGSFMKLYDISMAMICDAATERWIKMFEPREVECFKRRQLSWLNAGLRLGVGLGLGACLGLGIGVFLLVLWTCEARSMHVQRPKVSYDLS